MARISLVMGTGACAIAAVFLCGMISSTPVHASTASKAQYGPTSVYTGLAGWWTLDKVLNGIFPDSSGNGDRLTIALGATTTVNGKVNGGLSLLGGATNDAVIAASSAINFGGTGLTVSAWVYPVGTLTGGNHPVMSSREACGGGSSMNWQFYANESSSNGPYFDVFVGATEKVVKPGSTKQLSLNKWQLFTGTYDGSFLTLYNNGVSIGSAAASGAMNSNANRVWVANDSCNNAYNGYIDDIRIYSRALSAQEIQALYSAGFGSHVAVSSVGPGTLNSGLAGWWTFDGKNMLQNVADSSGNGASGYLVGVVATSSMQMPGKMGQALNFNGTSQYAVVDNVASAMQTGPASVSAWIKPSAAIAGGTSPTEVIFRLGEGPSNNDVTLSIGTFLGSQGTSQPCLDMSVWTGAAYNHGLSASCIWNANTWYHVVGTWNGSTLQTYINGVADGSPVAGTRGTTPYSTKAEIGRNINTNDSYFAGTVDDVRVYSRALTVQEIADLYTAGQGRQAVTPIGPGSLNSGLVGWWTFDGKNMLQNVADSSGQGNNGDMIGFTSTSSAVVPGKLGQALSFNGSNQYAVTGNVSFINAQNVPHSMFAWVHMATSSIDAIVSYGEFADSSNATGIGAFNGKLAWLNNCYNTTPSDSGLVIPLNSWAFVGLVRTASNLIYYVNGQSATVSNSSASSINTSNPFQLGLCTANSTKMGYMNGYIDDLRIYNRALSAQEVYQLYMMGR